MKAAKRRGVLFGLPATDPQGREFGAALDAAWRATRATLASQAARLAQLQPPDGAPAYEFFGTLLGFIAAI